MRRMLFVESDMRKKHSFLLTIFPSEEQRPALKGRLQFIATGSSFYFMNLEELQQIIENEILSTECAESMPGIQEGSPEYFPKALD